VHTSERHVDLLRDKVRGNHLQDWAAAFRVLRAMEGDLDHLGRLLANDLVTAALGPMVRVRRSYNTGIRDTIIKDWLTVEVPCSTSEASRFFEAVA
jgi:hypothetical protein